MSCSPHSPADSPDRPVPSAPDAMEQPAPTNAARAKAARPRATRLPKGLRVLVVEQNTILALDVEEMLLRHGVSQVAIANSAGEAMTHLRNNVFDAALLDLKLSGNGSADVAVCLDELQVPFAFAIGYGERPQLPPLFGDRMVIGKPYSEPYLVSRLAALVAKGA